jgi:hypothetical protein
MAYGVSVELPDISQVQVSSALGYESSIVAVVLLLRQPPPVIISPT